MISKYYLRPKILLGENLVLKFGLLYIVLCIAMPSGNIVGFPAKYISLALFLPLMSAIIIKRREFSRLSIISLSIFTILLSFSIIYSLTNGNSINSALGEVFYILNSVMSIIVIKFIYDYFPQGENGIRTAVYTGSTLIILLKMVVTILSFAGFLNHVSLVNYYESLFNSSVNSLPLGNGLIRFTSPNDWILLVALYYILQDKSKKKVFKYIFVFSIIFSIYIAYSRLMWFGVPLVFIAYISSLKNFVPNWKFFAYLIFLLGVLTLMAQTNYYDTIYSSISERYNGGAAEQSDEGREIMKYYLDREIDKNIILGNGVGSFPVNYVRFPELPWLYELQWMHLLMQFGALGIFIFLMSYAIVVYEYFLKSPYVYTFLPSVIMLIFWLSVGFFNCFYLTSSGGVMFGVLAMSFGTQRRQ